MVLEMLQTGEKCACMLLENLKISQPTLSHHMKTLVDSGIVSARKQGKWTYYSFSNNGVAIAKDLLSKITEFVENNGGICTPPDCPGVFFDGINSGGDSESDRCGDNVQSNNEPGSASIMKYMSIYEQAVRRPNGVSGVDPEQSRISTVLNTLKKNGIKVDRFNLESAPQEFVNNAEVNERLMDEGVEVLPIIVVDGKIALTKRYPTNDEFIRLLDLPSGILGKNKSAGAEGVSGCCCGSNTKSRCC